MDEKHDTPYQKHFRGMMARGGHKNPSTMDKSDYKKVDRSWKAKHEAGEITLAGYLLGRLERLVEKSEVEEDD